MNYEFDYKCSDEVLEEIPDSIVNLTGKSFYEAHTDKNALALFSEELKRHRGDYLCKVPLCMTVEAEAFGGRINFPNSSAWPKYDSHDFTRFEELSEIKAIDLEGGRISQVLNSVEILNNNGNAVLMNVDGPFTILAMLIDPIILYKGVLKHRHLTVKIMEVIEDSLVKYILTGINKGAKIISYSDPTGAMDIVGPKIYRDISGRISYNIFKRIEGSLDGTIVHLCGKTSTAFDKLGLCKSIPIEVESGLKYGEAIYKLLGNKEIKFIGHRCIKTTAMNMTKPVIWNIQLL